MALRTPKTPPIVHPAYDVTSEAETTPEPPPKVEENRITGVGYHGAQCVSFYVDGAGRKIITAPPELAGQVAR